ncbi:hypothetical protein, variant 1 [Aphanomyces astaci]|uniref:Uncharacterized protein n=1 Tax=Aphanomyces astaci TaxID=112090 RepID=W4H3P4_APHAT|nr:hypothetical protein, variant 2 [Aphanomyces astaci]XP_009824250.1 hypothetical protein, variant 1 [Aphanomyces astaci]ETV85772.1 hypothetical protein, variant 1 [Aphanomyces astaci]ETV85773.1 hypothetical protein, variant 2 [Aphanomyces astaci]|eukprot:XP_009824248.1 hypothetical protein, variant 2 [Aphanomyces astaci]
MRSRVTVAVVLALTWQPTIASPTAAEFIAQGVAYQLDTHDLIQAKHMYQAALSVSPDNVEALHLLGSVAYHEGHFHEAQEYLEQAISVSSSLDKSAMTHCNLAETLRKLHRPADGLHHGDMCFNATGGSEFSLLVLAWLYKDLDEPSKAVDVLRRLVAMNDQHLEAWDTLGTIYLDNDDLAAANDVFTHMIALDASDFRGYAGRGQVLHLQGHLDAAQADYDVALRINGQHDPTLQNVGILYQQLGHLDRAVAIYQQLLVRQPNNVALLNNLGAALLYTGRPDDARPYLEQSVRENPSNPQSFVNLKTYYADSGDLDMARQMLQRAYDVSHADVLRIDMATLLPQVFTSQAHLDTTRRNMHAAIDALLLLASSLHVENPEAFEIRPPFYLVYQGYNDLHLQTKLATLHSHSCPALHFTAPHIALGVGTLFEFDKTFRRLRIGFMSKFFVPNHAHGMLLRGVLAHLNRQLFHVTLVVVPDPQQQVDAGMAAAADAVKVLSMHLAHSQQEIAALELDVLVFADLMSEPMTYFAAFGRLAHVQAAFWGNPTTSGIPNVDYFISADAMESSPDPAVESHYSEQVVLLSGVGIWYDKPTVPAQLGHRRDHHLEDEWTIYMCPQSVYKLVPQFDRVLFEILRQDPQGHVVLLEARYPQWTRQLRTRLQQTINSTEMWNRVHFRPRVGGSDAFLKLLSVADVVLHPFPFGGSKTSAVGGSMHA